MCPRINHRHRHRHRERERERVRVRERDRVSEVSMVNDWPVVYRTQPLKMGCT